MNYDCTPTSKNAKLDFRNHLIGEGFENGHLGILLQMCGSEKRTTHLVSSIFTPPSNNAKINLRVSSPGDGLETQL